MKERRLSGDKDGKRDLLSGLITANDEFSDDGEQRLKDEELIGTGHDTVYRRGCLMSAIQGTCSCSTSPGTR